MSEYEQGAGWGGCAGFGREELGGHRTACQASSAQDLPSSSPLPLLVIDCRAWLAFVDEMRQAVGQVVLLTCPTDRLTSPEHAALHKAAAARNEELRSLVAEGRGGRARSASGGAGGGVEEEAPPPLMLLDMDALSRQLPKEWEISQVDFHHACHLASASANQREIASRRSRRRLLAALAVGHLARLPMCHKPPR